MYIHYIPSNISSLLM